MKNFRSVVIRSSAVNFGASVGLKGLLFLQAVVYARVFAPSEMGQLTTILLVVSFVMLFNQMGFQEFIIRDKSSPAEMINTALSVSLMTGGALFTVLFLSAPFCARFFHRPELTDQVRFMSFMVFAIALGLPNLLWVKHFKFGIAKVASFVDLTVSTSVTLLMAFNTDAGVWSLLVGKMSGFIGNYATVWIIAPSRPRLDFDRTQAAALYRFGWPLMISALANYLMHQGDSLMIRYFWGDESLAFYTLAYSLPFYLMEFTDVLIGSLLPAYAYLRESRERVISAFLQVNKYLMTAIVPCAFGLAVLADPLIRLVFGEKWVPAIPLLRILAMAFAVQLLAGYSWGILWLAWGKTRYLMYVKLWIVFYLCTVGAYLIKEYGALGGAYYSLSQAILTVCIVRFYILYRELGSLEFLKDSWKPLVVSGVSAGVIGVLALPFITNLFGLLLAGAAYLALYALISVLLDRSLLVEAKQMGRLLTTPAPSVEET